MSYHIYRTTYIKKNYLVDNYNIRFRVQTMREVCHQQYDHSSLKFQILCLVDILIGEESYASDAPKILKRSNVLQSEELPNKFPYYSHLPI
jgi:hypothetical protein